MDLGAAVDKSDRLCGLAWNSTRLHEKSNATLPAIHNSNNDDDDKGEVDSGGRNNGEMFFSMFAYTAVYNCIQTILKNASISYISL